MIYWYCDFPRNRARAPTRSFRRIMSLSLLSICIDLCALKVESFVRRARKTLEHMFSKSCRGVFEIEMNDKERLTQCQERSGRNENEDAFTYDSYCNPRCFTARIFRDSRFFHRETKNVIRKVWQRRKFDAKLKILFFNDFSFAWRAVKNCIKFFLTFTQSRTIHVRSSLRRHLINRSARQETKIKGKERNEKEKGLAQQQTIREISSHAKASRKNVQLKLFPLFAKWKWSSKISVLSRWNVAKVCEPRKFQNFLRIHGEFLPKMFKPCIEKLELFFG